MTRSTIRRTPLLLAALGLATTLAAADAAWTWSGRLGDKALSMLIIGDIDIQLRADPTTAFAHIGDQCRGRIQPELRLRRTGRWAAA